MLLRTARAAAGSLSAAAWPAAATFGLDPLTVCSSSSSTRHLSSEPSTETSAAHPHHPPPAAWAAAAATAADPAAPPASSSATLRHPEPELGARATPGATPSCSGRRDDGEGRPAAHRHDHGGAWSRSAGRAAPPGRRAHSAALSPFALQLQHQQGGELGRAGCEVRWWGAPAAAAAFSTAKLHPDIVEASQRKQNGISMKYILDFGTQPLDQQMLLSGRFIKEELPVRLAHRIVELNALPLALSTQSQIVKCKGWYIDSFHEIRAFPAIKDQGDVVRFTNMLKSALRRHANVVPAIAKGVEEYKRKLLTKAVSAETPSETADIQAFLDTFFMSRIAIRFLVGHHIALHEQATRPDHIGLVYTKCSPVHVAADAVADARAICFREYGDAPSVNVVGNPELRFAYVPSHLHHMIFELVKNSLRAVQDRYSKSDEEAPVISVVIAEGMEDITIKVADQGGGIPRSGVQHIWTYLYTTAKSPLPDLDDDDMGNLPAVLAGYGCGLPLSRLYARYFGGDLQIISMQGFGTDAYLHLNRLGSDEEPLPGKK